MFKNYNKSFEETENRRFQDEMDLVKRTTIKREELTKKYQDKPDAFIEDYDRMLKSLITSVIANFFANDFLRNDIINNIDILFRIRKAIVDNYCNNSSSQN